MATRLELRCKPWFILCTGVIGLMACGQEGPGAGSGANARGSLAGELPKPTAAALCDHTREIVVLGHGAPIDDEKWKTVRPGCIRDFEVKREQWGDGVYTAFLTCGLAAQDMRTMVQCNERAQHHAAQPKAPLKGEARPTPDKTPEPVAQTKNAAPAASGSPAASGAPVATGTPAANGTPAASGAH